MAIEFTQFLRPNGRRVPVEIDMPPDTEHKAEVIREAGGRFEIEVLTTGEISMEIVRGEDKVLAGAICGNGPDVPIHVAKMIDAAASRISAERNVLL